MAQRIIVGYDGPDGARAALAWALDEADRREASVEVLHADDLPQWAPAVGLTPCTAARPDSYDKLLTGLLERVVSGAAKTHPLVRVTTEVVRGHPSTALVDRSADAALLVVGGRGHGMVAGLLGSVACAVSAHAHCPVVVVRDEADTVGPAAAGMGSGPVTAGTRTAPAAAGPAVGPVVAGVDSSAQAPRVLEFAAEMAAERKAPLRVIRTWPPVNGLWEANVAARRAVTARERQPFDALVAALRESHPDLEITAEAAVQHPGSALDEAGAGAQLVVVGSRGHGTVRGLLLGSVSRHLLRRCPCTVAVVHSLN